MVSHPERTKDIARAVYFLQQGRVVAFPTGTSYGLAVDTLQGWALQRLRRLKQRPQEQTFTVFMSPTRWSQYLHLEEAEQKILTALIGQPLTLLVRPQAPLAHVAHESRIGVRQIDHPLMQELADAWPTPLTATSANRTGRPPCFTPDSIIKELASTVDEAVYDLSLAAILDAGELPSRSATTIARLENGHIKIVRAGSLTANDIAAGLA